MDSNVSQDTILNHNVPELSAKAFINFCRDQSEGLGKGIRTIHFILKTGDFFLWDGSTYRILKDMEVKKMISDFLKSCKCKKDKSDDVISFIINRARIDEVFNQLKFEAADGVHINPYQHPYWLFADHLNDLPNPQLCIRFLNKILCIDEFIKTKNAEKSIIPNNSRFFSTFQIPYEINASDYMRLKPIQWLNFLDQTFDADEESITLLQQWFGYCLIYDNIKFQKMLLLIGPSRSGKGIISRILKAMIGEENSISPKISDFKDNFMLENFIGKSLCIFEDSRMDNKCNEVKEFALTVTGHDKQCIRRKYKPAIDMYLICKLMLISNDIPSIADDSSALSNRFMILKTHKSVKGREDYDLFDKLKMELPRILWWALEGYISLIEANNFIEPSSRRDDKEYIRQTQSPILHFVEECCNLDPSLEIPKHTLYNAYEAWCLIEGITPKIHAQFASTLISNCNIGKKRSAQGNVRNQVFVGISLKDRS